MDSSIDFSGILVFIALLWIVQAIAVGAIANQRRRNPLAWALLAIVTSPFVAAILLVAAPIDKRPRVECLNCGEMVITDAKVCHFCGKQSGD